MPSVLFVCTANICRSPMASALFKRKLAQEGDLEGWLVDSAGTWAIEGEPASARSLKVLADRGMDITGHRSRSVRQEILRSYDLILTMERGHKEALRVEFPEISERVFLLTEMAGFEEDIKDPIGGSAEDYEDTIQELEELIERGYERICELVKVKK